MSMKWKFWTKKKEEPQPKVRLIGLTKAETALVKNCLDYSAHRIKEHGAPGLVKIVNPLALNALRRKL